MAIFGSKGPQAIKSFNRKQVLSYPLNVAYEDGHYMLFKIFEKFGRNYESPYVQSNQPSQLINSALTGLRGALTSKISAIRNKLEQKLGKGTVKLLSNGGGKIDGQNVFDRKHGKWTTWGQKGQSVKDQNVGNIL